MSVVAWRRAISTGSNWSALSYPQRRNLFSWVNSSDDSGNLQHYKLVKTINADPEEVYDVVSEVSKYHEFIPYCVESFVNKRNPVDRKPTEAGLRVGFRQYDERYTCKVECKEKLNGKTQEYSVLADSISHNLFQALSTQWTISAHPTRHNATQAELMLKFKFKSRLYNSVSSIFARSVTELVMKAFEKRVFELKKLAIKASTTLHKN